MTPQDLAAINLSRSRRSSALPTGSYNQLTSLAPRNVARGTLGTTATAGAMAALKASASNSNNFARKTIPPPPPLGSDPALIAAYNLMMQDQAQGDDESGILRRNLQSNLDLSQKDRLHNILTTHQNFADRGILNSGVALHNDEDVNTLYDQQVRNYNDQEQDSIRNIGRRHQGVVNDYHNAEVTASHNAEVARADAAAAKLKADNDAQTVQDQIAGLLAQLSPATSAYVPPPESQVYNPAPMAPYKPKPPVVYKPPVIKSPIAKLTLKGPK